MPHLIYSQKFFVLLMKYLIPMYFYCSSVLKGSSFPFNKEMFSCGVSMFSVTFGYFIHLRVQCWEIGCKITIKQLFQKKKIADY